MINGGPPTVLSAAGRPQVMITAHWAGWADDERQLGPGGHVRGNCALRAMGSSGVLWRPVHDQQFGPRDRVMCGWWSPSSDHPGRPSAGRSVISGSGPTTVLSAAGRPQVMITAGWAVLGRL